MSDFVREFVKDVDRKGVEVSGDKTEEVWKGKEGRKAFVSAQIEQDTRNRQLPMFTKEININFTKTGNYEAEREHILEKYNYLKRNGFPVPPTYRVSKEGSLKILMTDMTEGGRKMVYDIHSDSLPPENVVNWSDVKKQLSNIVSLAYKNKVRINGDAYALVLDPVAKSSRVVLLDLGAGIGIMEDGVTEENLLRDCNSFVSGITPKSSSTQRSNLSRRSRY